VRGAYVEPVAVEREGQRPERTRYAITRAGREHLRDLLRRAWRELWSPADPIQLALAARSELTDEEIEELLSGRARGLEERLALLDGLAPSAPAPEMVDRLRALTRAELDWTRSVLAQTGSPARKARR
jgi:hypothetical protein